MPNMMAQIKESIWRDPEFRALSRAAQAMYCQLLSQKELDRAGMQPLMVAKWSKGCTALTEDDIWRDLAELQNARFAFFDTDTDELFVRAYMRQTEVWRSPNFVKNALRSAASVASIHIRHELAKELRRLHRSEATRVADDIDPDRPTPTRGVSEHVENPSGTLPEGMNPSGTLASEGESESEGSVPEVVKKGGGAPARPTPTCHRHPHGTDSPCRACGRAREQAQAWEREQSVEAERQHVAARAASVRAIANCTLCDIAGWLLDSAGEPVEPAERCGHRRRLSVVGASL